MNRPGPGSMLEKGLNAVERAGNLLPDPIMLFLTLAASIPILSAILAGFDWNEVHPVTGETVRVVNLLEPVQLQRMFTEAVRNFVSFPPLGAVLVVMMGIGIAERSGWVATAMKQVVLGVPPRLLSGALVFAGVLSSVAADAGFVVLPPLGAMLFSQVGRHPLAGVAAAFAGVSAGLSANLVLTPLDALQAGFTQAAAQIVDPGVTVSATANYYLMVASVPVVTLVAWWITDRVVEPRLGPWPRRKESQPEVTAGRNPGVMGRERRANRLALFSVLVVSLFAAGLVIPEEALLRSKNGGPQPFFDSIVVLIAMFFAVPGIVYGLAAGAIRRVGDVAKMMGDALGSMGSYIVLTFIAAQFVAYFNWSNLGLLLGVSGGGLLRHIGLGGAPLLVGIVSTSALLNVFVLSANAKWAMLSPVVVPMAMELGLSPALAQAAYRIGDSITNVVSPLLPYFPIIIALAQRYDPRVRMGALLSLMLPYALALGVAWVLLLVLWYQCGLPLGPGSPLWYIPPSAP